MKQLAFIFVVLLPLFSMAKTDYQCPVMSSASTIQSRVAIVTASDFDELDYPMDFNPGILSAKLITDTVNSQGQTLSTTEEVLYGGTFLGGLEVDRMVCGFLGSPQNTYTGHNQKFIVSDMCRIKSTSPNPSPFNKVSFMMNVQFKTGGKISIDVMGDHPANRELQLDTCF